MGNQFPRFTGAETSFRDVPTFTVPNLPTSRLEAAGEQAIGEAITNVGNKLTNFALGMRERKIKREAEAAALGASQDPTIDIEMRLKDFGNPNSLSYQTFLNKWIEISSRRSALDLESKVKSSWQRNQLTPQNIMTDVQGIVEGHLAGTPSRLRPYMNIVADGVVSDSKLQADTLIAKQNIDIAKFQWEHNLSDFTNKLISKASEVMQKVRFGEKGTILNPEVLEPTISDFQGLEVEFNSIVSSKPGLMPGESDVLTESLLSQVKVQSVLSSIESSKSTSDDVDALRLSLITRTNPFFTPEEAEELIPELEKIGSILRRSEADDDELSKYLHVPDILRQKGEWNKRITGSRREEDLDELQTELNSSLTNGGLFKENYKPLAVAIYEQRGFLKQVSGAADLLEAGALTPLSGVDQEVIDAAYINIVEEGIDSRVEVLRSKPRAVEDMGITNIDNLLAHIPPEERAQAKEEILKGIATAGIWSEIADKNEGVLPSNTASAIKLALDSNDISRLAFAASAWNSMFSGRQLRTKEAGFSDDDISRLETLSSYFGIGMSAEDISKKFYAGPTTTLMTTEEVLTLTSDNNKIRSVILKDKELAPAFQNTPRGVQATLTTMFTHIYQQELAKQSSSPEGDIIAQKIAVSKLKDIAHLYSLGGTQKVYAGKTTNNLDGPESMKFFEQGIATRMTTHLVKNGIEGKVLEQKLRESGIQSFSEEDMKFLSKAIPSFLRADRILPERQLADIVLKKITPLLNNKFPQSKTNVVVGAMNKLIEDKKIGPVGLEGVLNQTFNSDEMNFRLLMRHSYIVAADSREPGSQAKIVLPGQFPPFAESFDIQDSISLANREALERRHKSQGKISKGNIFTKGELGAVIRAGTLPPERTKELEELELGLSESPIRARDALFDHPDQIAAALKNKPEVVQALEGQLMTLEGYDPSVLISPEMMPALEAVIDNVESENGFNTSLPIIEAYIPFSNKDKHKLKGTKLLSYHMIGRAIAIDIAKLKAAGVNMAGFNEVMAGNGFIEDTKYKGHYIYRDVSR